MALSLPPTLSNRCARSCLEAPVFSVALWGHLALASCHCDEVFVLSITCPLEVPQGRGCLNYFRTLRDQTSTWYTVDAHDVGWLTERMDEWVTRDFIESIETKTVGGGAPSLHTMHTHQWKQKNY